MNKFSKILLLAFVISSCGKENVLNNPHGSFSVINASPGTPAFQVFVGDTTQMTSTAIGLRATSGYLSVSPGSKNIRVVNNANFATRFIQLNNEEISANSSSTFLIYDTLVGPLTANTGTLRAVRLSDDLSAPTTGNVKARFVHAAINAPAVDVTLLRTSVTPNDSITLTNRSYIGNNPSGATLSAFANIPLGTYSVRVKAAGTQNVVLTATAPLTMVNGIYTLFATGTAKGQPLSVGIVRNAP